VANLTSTRRSCSTPSPKEIRQKKANMYHAAIDPMELVRSKKKKKSCSEHGLICH
jgi:hypothetical protein